VPDHEPTVALSEPISRTCMPARNHACAGPPERGLLTALAIASVALAWLSVHTV